MTQSYLDLRLAEFLDRVSRREPAPGGGAAAAVTVSLSTSLAAMAARYSTRHVADGEQLVHDAESLRHRSRDLADDDAGAYQAVIAAYAAARTNGSGDRRQVNRRINAALLHAAEIPLRIAEVGAETARLAALLAAEGKHDVRGDALTAVLLADAGTRSAAHLVAVNIEAFVDDDDKRGGGRIEDPRVDVETGGVADELLRRAAETVAAARAATASVGAPG